MAEAADSLYEIPPDQFTAARNALAARLRKEGERAEADEVKKMRRPSLAAWALNQVARQHPELVEGVLEAGGELRDAMQQALDGDASGLRDAQGAQRQAVDAAVAAGTRVLADAGHAPSETAKQRMAGTLHAAVVDETVAARLREGTLDEDRDAPGFGLEAGSLPRSSGGRARVPSTPGAGACAPSGAGPAATGPAATGPAGAGPRAPSGAGPAATGPAGAARPGAGPAGAAIKGGTEDTAARRRAAQAAARAEAEERRQARVRRAELEAEADRLARRAARLRGEAEDAERQAAEARKAAEAADKEAAAAAQRLAEEGGDG